MSILRHTLLLTLALAPHGSGRAVAANPPLGVPNEPDRIEHIEFDTPLWVLVIRPGASNAAGERAAPDQLGASHPSSPDAAARRPTPVSAR